jgi:hypothetical protein
VTDDVTYADAEPESRPATVDLKGGPSQDQSTPHLTSLDLRMAGAEQFLGDFRNRKPAAVRNGVPIFCRIGLHWWHKVRPAANPTRLVKRCKGCGKVSVTGRKSIKPKGVIENQSI